MAEIKSEQDMLITQRQNEIFIEIAEKYRGQYFRDSSYAQRVYQNGTEQWPQMFDKLSMQGEELKAAIHCDLDCNFFLVPNSWIVQFMRARLL